jgi:hypothetical protein
MGCMEIHDRNDFNAAKRVFARWMSLANFAARPQ